MWWRGGSSKWKSEVQVSQIVAISSLWRKKQAHINPKDLWDQIKFHKFNFNMYISDNQTLMHSDSLSHWNSVFHHFKSKIVVQ